MESAKVKQFEWADRLAGLWVPRTDGKIVEALTDEWFRARRGRLTASTRAEVIANMARSQLVKLIEELDSELNPSWARNDFSNDAMRWGNDHEAQAIADVELETASETFNPGFVLEKDRTFCGATPDFYIGDDVSGQIKCPYNPTNHLKFVHQRTLPSKYWYQVQWEAWVSRRKKILFVSFDPRQPMATRSAHIWIDADLKLWDKFSHNADKFREMYETGYVPLKAEFTGFGGSAMPQFL